MLAVCIYWPSCFATAQSSTFLGSSSSLLRTLLKHTLLKGVEIAWALSRGTILGESRTGVRSTLGQGLDWVASRTVGGRLGLGGN